MNLYEKFPSPFAFTKKSIFLCLIKNKRIYQGTIHMKREIISIHINFGQNKIVICCDIGHMELMP